jgi:hypothetical protein
MVVGYKSLRASRETAVRSLAALIAAAGLSNQLQEVALALIGGETCCGGSPEGGAQKDRIYGPDAEYSIERHGANMGSIR